MLLSDKIRILRKAKGLSQEQLGFKLEKTSKYGISRQSISDWENGKSEPKLDNIRDLSKVLNVSFDVLLNEDIDLDDPDVLSEVLKAKSNLFESKTGRAPIYYFYYSDKRLFSIFTNVITILSFIICSYYMFYFYFNNVNSIILIILSVLLILNVIYYIIKLIRLIMKSVNSPYGERAGCLTYNHLRIEALKSLSTTLYAPISSVEYIKRLDNKKSKSGVISIKIKEIDKEIILNNIYNADKLVNTYYQIVGPDTNLDDFRFKEN